MEIKNLKAKLENMNRIVNLMQIPIDEMNKSECEKMPLIGTVIENILEKTGCTLMEAVSILELIKLNIYKKSGSDVAKLTKDTLLRNMDIIKDVMDF